MQKSGMLDSSKDFTDKEVIVFLRRKSEISSPCTYEQFEEFKTLEDEYYMVTREECLRIGLDFNDEEAVLDHVENLNETDWMPVDDKRRFEQQKDRTSRLVWWLSGLIAVFIWFCLVGLSANILIHMPGPGSLFVGLLALWVILHVRKRILKSIRASSYKSKVKSENLSPEDSVWEHGVSTVVLAKDIQGLLSNNPTSEFATTTPLNDRGIVPDDDTSLDPTINAENIISDNVEKPSRLRWLPIAFYIIACLLFIGWSIIAFSTRNWWTGLGWGMISALACLATGRVIELLQIIADELYRKRMSESP